MRSCAVVEGLNADQDHNTQKSQAMVQPRQGATNASKNSKGNTQQAENTKVAKTFKYAIKETGQIKTASNIP